MRILLLLLAFGYVGYSVGQEAEEKITFPSLDELPVTGIIYEIDKAAPVIVLCHQARFNKFEYDGIAQRLNSVGFNCLAIDQRSGGPIGSAQNETKLRAIEAGKGTDFLDAAQDITAAVNYAADRYSGTLILWGSSYSSTLVLYEAAVNKNVDAVVAFSPGNYFANELGDLSEKLDGLSIPFFVTSSKSEATELSTLMKKVTMEHLQIQFIPAENGHHGSRALWVNQDGGEEYWDAISSFLKELF